MATGEPASDTSDSVETSLPPWPDQSVPRAVLDSHFLSRIEDLRSKENNNAHALLLEAQRVYQEPPPEEWSGDPLDIPGMRPPWERKAIDANYALCFTAVPPGTTGDVMSLKTQCDFLACEERAFRTRHCSPVRAAIHAAARTRGHGSGKGVITEIKGYADDLIKRGGM